MKLLSKSSVRWSAWFLLACIFAVSCLGLANWQLDRREQAVARVERMVKNYEKQPLEFESIKNLSSNKVTDFEWTPVSLEGNYLEGSELLVRNRPVAGQPGFIQLLQFKLATGELVIIERGWIPADSNLSPALSFRPSTEAKNVTARVRLGEQTPNRDSPEGFVTSIKLDELAKFVGGNLEQDFYLQLMSESPAETSYPQPLSKPILDEGNHLSYAVQWVLFAIMGFFALFWAIRQESEFRKIEKDPSYQPRKRIKKGLTDAEVEDNIIDSKS